MPDSLTELLRSIREPTEAMLTVAAGVGEEEADYLAAVWRAMVDARIEEIEE